MSDSDGDQDMNKLFESSDEEGDASPGAKAPQKDSDAQLDDLRNADIEDADAPEPTGNRSDAEPGSEPAAAVRRYGDDEEEEEEAADADMGEPPPEEVLGPPLELEGPLVDGPPPDNIRLVKASNIVGVQTKPFVPEHHDFEPEEYLDPVTGHIRVRLSNLIRWRHVQHEDGTIGRESNARFVRWSDGSLQLLLGDEVLDVAETDVAQDNCFVYVRHKGFIQAQAQLTKRMAFRPSSITSRAHRRLTAALDRRHGVKSTKMQSTVTVVDPNREKAERAKAEESRIRDREGLQRRQEKEMRKYTRAPVSRASAGGLSAAYLEAADEEEDVEEEDDGLTASERARQALARPRYDSRAEEEAERRLANAKRAAPPGLAPPGKRQRAAYPEEEEDEGMDDFIVDDDEEDDEIGRRKATGRRRVAFSDDEAD